MVEFGKPNQNVLEIFNFFQTVFKTLNFKHFTIVSRYFISQSLKPIEGEFKKVKSIFPKFDCIHKSWFLCTDCPQKKYSSIDTQLHLIFADMHLPLNRIIVHLLLIWNDWFIWEWNLLQEAICIYPSVCSFFFKKQPCKLDLIPLTNLVIILLFDDFYCQITVFPNISLIASRFSAYQINYFIFVFVSSKLIFNNKL